MTDGFTLTYLSAWSPEKVRSIIAAMDASGFHVVNPGSGAVLVIDENLRTSEGDYIHTDQAGLTQRLRLVDRNRQNFKFWMDADTDFYCRVMRLAAGSVVVQLYLDGLGSVGLHKATETAIQMSLHDIDLLGLVVDISGGSEDTDWDEVILGRGVEIEAVPDLVVVRRASVDRLNAALSHGSSPTSLDGELAAFDRSGLLRDQI